MEHLISQLPFFTPKHRNLAQNVAHFVAQEIERRAGSEDDIEGLARDFIALLAQAGFLKYAAAESKLDVRALCLIREELSYSSSLADLAFVMQGLGTFAIAGAAPDHVRDFWLSRAASGKAIAAFALTEPNAGSDVAAIQTTARRDGESYVIDGRKRFISTPVSPTSTPSSPKPERAKMVVPASPLSWLVRRCRVFASSNGRR
jgi:acyl-CoA dehydrogenase